MSLEDVEKAWSAQAAVVPIEPRMIFKAQGLVLGAGTVLAASGRRGQRSHTNIEAAEARLWALLASAYGSPVGSEVIGHVRRAAQKWSDGDRGLAELHLALTGLGPLARPQNDARRLFMADVLMEAGAQPEMILSALKPREPDRDEAKKLYNTSQPRVPAGNGRISGQWARIGRNLLNSLSAEALARLAARFSAPAVFLGVLFMSTNKTSPEEEYPIPGHPGLRLARLIGETRWRILYNDDDGAEQDLPELMDGTLRDPQGKIVGRVLPNGQLAIDLVSIAPNPVKDRKPRYCPAPIKDNYGGGPESIARAYEDQVKHFVNPEAPTPSGLAVALPNPDKVATPVKFDDCRHSTGAMIEAKGPTFTDLIRRAQKSNFIDSVDGKTLKQALNQIAAAGSREIQWYFADDYAADHVRKLFREFEGMSDRIQIKVLVYKGPRK